MRAIMKSSFVAVMSLGMFVSSARAQEIVSVKIPFPFVVDHKEFPAGRYEIRSVEDAGSVVAIEGVDHKASTFALTMNAYGGDPAGNEPALVFKKVENRYRLSEIWESNTEGRELSGRSSDQKTAQAETPSGMSDPRVVIVTASRN